MKKTAILVDAEWFRRRLKKCFASPPTPTPGTRPNIPNGITAELFYRNAVAMIDPAEEEIFRFFCYDCEPFAKAQRNPIDKSWVRYGPTHPGHIARMTFFSDLAAMPFVALRRGIVVGRGWEIRDETAQRLFASPNTDFNLTAADLIFGLEQKGGDMRIGMDVASLSLKKLVERIVLISGDTDMVPAMKLARREGIQVCVVQVGSNDRLPNQLVEDSDIMRVLTPVP